MFTIICNMLIFAVVLGGAVALVVGIIAIPFYVADKLHFRQLKKYVDETYEKYKEMPPVPAPLSKANIEELTVIYKDCEKKFVEMGLHDPTMKNKIIAETLIAHGWVYDAATQNVRKGG